MKIGELAAAAQTQSETIRYYERQGLMPQAARTGANYRSYQSHHVERLAFIRHCRSLDMTLDEIRVLLRFKDSPSDNCGEVNDLLDEHIGHVQQRIRELRVLARHLAQLREQCAAASAGSDCGILSGLAQAARSQGRRPANRDETAHIGGTHRQVGATASRTDSRSATV